jgi:hypothetical protein
MIEYELKPQILALLNDKTLFEETNLKARMDAIDFIKYAGQARHLKGQDLELGKLYQEATNLQARLVETNEALFQRMRSDLRAGNYTQEILKAYLMKFTDYAPRNRGQPRFEFDVLDALLANVIFWPDPPSESRSRTSGMIRYEPTPANIILELIDSVPLLPQDLFVDIGSGLGLVVILVNLLTGVPALGIEYDPAYCAYAQARAAELGLKDVTFINVDARQADFDQGSIFYLFTPFIDEIFDIVIEKLRPVAKKRSIYVCSYGTCTTELAKLPWLQIRDPAMEHDFSLAIFISS